jgi:hypothetical protein
MSMEDFLEINCPLGHSLKGLWNHVSDSEESLR